MPQSRFDRALALVGLCRRTQLASAQKVVSALEAAAAQASRAQVRNRAILRAMPDLMFVQTAEGEYLDYYARDPQLLAVPPEQFLGRTMHDVLPPDLAGEFARCFGEVIASGGPVLHRYSLPKNGSLGHFEARIVRCEDGTILSIVRDLTHERDAEQRLVAASREIYRQTRLMGLAEVAATLGRDLKQPLAAIVTNAQVALRWLETDRSAQVPLREALRDVVADGERAATLVQDTHTLFSGRSEDFATVSMNEVVRDAYRIAALHLDSVHASKQFELCESLPPVLGNRGQLKHVVLQLILNAADALAQAPAGSPKTVTTRSTTIDGQVHIVVSDTGSGINEAEAVRIFEPLYTSKPEGIGMGLAASRSIIETHGGTLWVAANEPRGAAFHFTLPIAR